MLPRRWERSPPSERIHSRNSSRPSEKTQVSLDQKLQTRVALSGQRLGTGVSATYRREVSVAQLQMMRPCREAQCCQCLFFQRSQKSRILYHVSSFFCVENYFTTEKWDQTETPVIWIPPVGSQYVIFSTTDGMTVMTLAFMCPWDKSGAEKHLTTL